MKIDSLITDTLKNPKKLEVSISSVDSTDKVDFNSKTIDSISMVLEKVDNLTLKLDSLLKEDLINITNEQLNNDTLFGLDISVARILIPTGVTIFIFFLGFFIKWVIQKRDKKNEYDSKKTIVSNWTKLLKEPILQQANSCRQLAIKLRNSNELHPLRFSYNSMHANKLDEFSLSELIQVYVINSTGNSEDKTKDLFNTISQIEFLSKIENQIPIVYKTYQDLTFEYMNKWNIAFKYLDEIKSDMIQNVAGNPTHRSLIFFQQYNHITNQYVNSFPNGANIKETKDNLLDPLITLTNKLVITSPNDEYIHKTRKGLQELNILYKQWEVHFKGNAILFYDLAINLVSSYKSLRNAVIKSDQRETKSIWKIS